MRVCIHVCDGSSSSLAMNADTFLTNHPGTTIAWSLGFLFFVVGWFGYHWIQRRRFYRRRQANPFSSYSRYWLVTRTESCLVLCFFFSLMLGIVCGAAGVVDLIDGPG